MRTITFPVGPFQCNCTILAHEERGEAVVIDPGDDADRITAVLAKLGCRVCHILHTHAHLDHIGATRAVHASLGGEVCLHKDDRFLYDNLAMQGEVLGITIDPVTAPVTRHIGHGDAIEAAGFVLKVMHTPGHTPGSVCFHLATAPEDCAGKPPLLFSGDTLFLGSIGRTDLWGGDYGQIIASLKERVVKVAPETRVIPGHGQNTTIARELKDNPFLK